MKARPYSNYWSVPSQRFFLLVFSILVGNVAIAHSAPNGLGWITRFVETTNQQSTTQLEAFEVLHSRASLGSNTSGFSPASGSPSTWTFSAGQAHAITPEIQTLADGLLRDPLRIFNWVRGNIAYVPYFGCKKGATLTLFERSGNDLDTCALLVASLRAAGYDAAYQWGVTLMPRSGASGTWLASWLGVNPGHESDRFKAGGYPPGFTDFVSDGKNPVSIFQRIVRSWVVLRVGGEEFALDPVFKPTESIAGVSWGSVMNFDKAAFLATSEPSYYLNGLVAALQSWLKANRPNAYPWELLGKNRIATSEATRITDRNQTFPHGSAAGYAVETWDTLPEELHSHLRLTCGGLDHTFRLAELGGQRLTVTFETANSVKVWLDDDLISTNSASVDGGGSFPLEVNISHPHSNGEHDQQDILKCRPGSTQVILYAFNPGTDLLRKCNERLEAYRRRGLPNESREVLSETLNVLGLSWMRQTRLFSEMVDNIAHRISVDHHRVGRSGQENNTFVDIGLQISTASKRDAGGATNIGPQLLADSFVASALEHGVFRQLQGPAEAAASTISILANSSSNLLSSRDSWMATRQLLTGYPGGQLSNLDADMQDSSPNENAVAFLPQNGQVAIQQWAGAGYCVYLSSPSGASVKMTVSGALSGGYRSTPGHPEPLYVLSVFNAGSTHNSTTPIALPALTGADPVDLTTGQFTVDTTDLTIGQGALPRGITLSRHYHGAQRYQDICGLGLGWRHNLDIRIIERSETEAALGEGTAEQMLPALVAAWVLHELAGSAHEANRAEWDRMLEATQWFEESLRQNAVSIILGARTLQFLKLPDGNYLTPPGLPHTLSKDFEGHFILKERHGNTYRFDQQRRLAEVEDLWGKKATLSYDGNDRLGLVSDCYGRSLTLHYTSNRLTGVSDSTSRSVAYEFDSQGHLSIATDPEGKQDHFDYDDGHRLIRHRDHDNRVIVENTMFDTFDRIVEQRSQGLPERTWRLYYAPGCTIEENPKTNRTCHLFDEKNRPAGQIDPLNRRTHVFYDGEHHAIRTRSHSGNETVSTYDGHHNLLTVRDPSGFTNLYTYDSVHRPIQTQDRRGNQTIFTYNSHHQPLTVSNALAEITVNSYRDSGELENVTDPDDFKTRYEFDEWGNRNRTLFPGGASVSAIYNDRGDPISTTDELSRTTTFEYNARREQILTTFPDTFARSQTYDNNRNVASATDELNRTTAYAYSPTRRLLVTTLPGANHAITNIYDERDWPVEFIDPLGLKTKTEFNSAQQPIKVIDPLGRRSQTFYDEEARAKVAADAQDIGVFREFTPRDEVTISFNVAGRNQQGAWLIVATNSFAFDAEGNQTFLTNRNGQTWAFTFDELNRLAAARTPLGRVASQTWNKRGLLASRVEPSGQTNSFTYDGRGRLTNQIGEDYSLSLTLDDAGNVIQQSETSANQTVSTVRRVFDHRNRVTYYTNSFNEVIGYTWDAAGQLRKLTYPDGQQVQYDYDELGRLFRVTDWSNRVTTLEWDAGSRLTRLNRPNGTFRTLTNDDAGQLVRLEERLPTGRLVALQRFGYDLSGRITNKFSVPVPKPFLEPTTTATYDADDRLTMFNGQAISHDVDGNLSEGPLSNSIGSLSGQTANGTAVFAWDARNRLTAVAPNENTTIDPIIFGYSPDTYLETITRGNETERLVVDPHSSPRTQVLERVRPDGDRIRYVYALGVGLLYEEQSDGTVRVYHYDHVGSTIALTDESARVIARAEYTPYGALSHWESETLVPDTPFLYNGRVGVYTDRHTGLLQMRARFYSPQLRRFLSADPSGFGGGPNFYAYANGNPLSFADPFGLGADHVSADEVISLRISGFHANSTLAVCTDCEGLGFWDIVDIGLVVFDIADTILGAAGPDTSLIVVARRGGSTALDAAKRGVLADANFAQRTFNQTFSSDARFAGQTIGDVAAALRSGSLKPADIPIEYIVRDGNTLMLNTRSAQALQQAGVPRAQWNAMNMTGNAAAEARLTSQLQRNNLTSQGVRTVTPLR